jgi:hypothetical protein
VDNEKSGMRDFSGEEFGAIVRSKIAGFAATTADVRIFGVSRRKRGRANKQPDSAGKVFSAGNHRHTALSTLKAWPCIQGVNACLFSGKPVFFVFFSCLFKQTVVFSVINI